VQRGARRATERDAQLGPLLAGFLKISAGLLSSLNLE